MNVPTRGELKVSWRSQETEEDVSCCSYWHSPQWVNVHTLERESLAQRIAFDGTAIARTSTVPSPAPLQWGGSRAPQGTVVSGADGWLRRWMCTTGQKRLLQTSITHTWGSRPSSSTGINACLMTHSWIASVMWGTTAKEQRNTHLTLLSAPVGADAYYDD